MKKIILILTILFICIGFCGCTNFYGWYLMSLPGYGTMSVPEQWTCYIDNGYIYVDDENATPIMFQTASCSGYEVGAEGIVDSNKYFDNIQAIQCLSDCGFSNGVVCGKETVLADGQASEKYYITIDLYDDINSNIELIVWDESIDKHILEKMAWSFREYDEYYTEPTK